MPVPALLLCLLLAGCARTPLLVEHLPEPDSARQVELTAVPFHPQEDYQCGPAALATVLGWGGTAVEPDELVPRVYLPARRGSLQPEIQATARHYGHLAYELEPRLPALLAELSAGHPVLVLQNLGAGPWPVWHYAVVVGFDAERQYFILRSGTTRREKLSARRFLASWARAEAWALAVLPAGRLPTTATLDRYVRAAADLEATGPPAAAERAWTAARQHWPEAPAVHIGVGNARYHQQDLAGAGAAFIHALRRDPEHTAARYNLARVYLEAGCHTEAQRQIAEARAHLHRLPAMEPAVAQTERELRNSVRTNAACSLALPAL